MKTNIKENKYSILLLVMITWLFAQCTPIDQHYKEYLENAEKVYPGRVDSILFKPGKNRAAIRTLLSTDSRVTKMRISWGQNNSFETEISPNEIAKHKETVIPDIAEGIYTFEVRTYDDQGNQSMRSEVFGRVYGEIYTENLNNRVINYINRDKNDDLVIRWFSESLDSTLLGTQLTYLNIHGDSTSILIRPDIDSTVLVDAVEESVMKFRTLYKPSSLAIDTFYAAQVDFIPEDFFEPDRELYPRGDWSIAGFSSENNNDRHAAKNLIDDKSDTFWIARYENPGSTDYPNHWVTIDMKAALEVDGFMFAQKNGDRKIRELEVFISMDNTNWESAGVFGIANVNRDYQYVNLPQKRLFRYFKIVPIAGHDSQKQPGLAEAGTFKFE